jgi:endonuclease/exonuclease/phosphatase family metal-dependent hydrolase
MVRRTVLPFVLASFLTVLSCSDRIVVLSYNVENLFDDRQDGREYPDYSGKSWSRESYQRKLAAVARAVRAACAGGPDILCLQEVESEVALRDLRDRHLSNVGYRYLVFVPQQGAATTVACLSRLPVVRTRAHAVGSFEGLPLRHILEIQVEYQGSTLYLFNNHWKSKSGGVEATAPARRKAADVLVKRVRDILGSDDQADVLVLGDLNENLEEYEQTGGRYSTATVFFPAADGQSPAGDLAALFVTPFEEQAGLQDGRLVFYEPWYEIAPGERGSSAYRGQWQTPDRILLSAGMFDGEGFSYVPGSFEAVKAEFLVDPASGFPLRWRGAGRGEGTGTSDHLPLRLAIESTGPH